MKEIIAIVRPHLAQEVVDSLRMAPLEGMVVHEVKGFGRQKSYLENYSQTEYGTAFLPKVEITVWVEDFRAAEVLERLESVARTGRMGDGKILVLPADTAGEEVAPNAD